MKFTFVEKKMEPSDNLRAYAEKKIGKLDKLFDSEATAKVVFSPVHGRFLAEITISSEGMFYRASELTSDMYASVDSGVAAIETQIRKNKKRLSKHVRVDELDASTVPVFPDEPEAEKEFDIVRTKRFSIKPMSIEDAILQMNLLGHEFFVFKDMDADEAIAVVYRRKDGGYGLICDSDNS